MIFAFSATCAPTWAEISLTVPSCRASSACSIFIASTTARRSPLVTVAPGATKANVVAQGPNGVFIYHVKVVQRELDAVNYLNRSGSTKVSFVGTDLMPPLATPRGVDMSVLRSKVRRSGVRRNASKLCRRPACTASSHDNGAAHRAAGIRHVAVAVDAACVRRRPADRAGVHRVHDARHRQRAFALCDRSVHVVVDVHHQRCRRSAFRRPACYGWPRMGPWSTGLTNTSG